MEKYLYDRIKKHFRKISVYLFAFEVFVILLLNIIFFVYIHFCSDALAEDDIFQKSMVVVICSISLVVIYFFLNFRVYIFSVWESKTDSIEIEKVRIKGFNSPWLMADNLDNPNYLIKRFYPRDMEVNRIDIICITTDGRKIKCKMVCSKKKRFLICEVFDKPINITYGKYSKIIYRYSSIDGKTDEKTIDKLNKTF